MGGQLAIVQSVAWANMFWNRAHASPVISPQVLAQAAKETMDGKHPCSICKKLDRDRAKEKSKTKELYSKMSDYPKPHLMGWETLVPSQGKFSLLMAKENKDTFRLPPPTEPPRFS